MHGITQAAQAVDITPQGSPCDLKTVGEIGARPVALYLKQRQQTEQPGGGLKHETIVSRIED